MTRRINGLRCMPVWGSDGQIGRVSDVLFDDSRWSVRYLAVLSDKLPGAPIVLVRPRLLQRIEDDEGRVYVPFTRSQVAILPDLDSDMPVSRRKTVEQGLLLPHVPSWAAGGPWGSLTIPSDFFRQGASRPPGGRPADPHLRSFGEVRGYRARGPQGAIGRVRDMIVDEGWLISEIEIQTRGWAPAYRLMIPAGSVVRISWRARAVIVNGPKEPARGGVPQPSASMGGSQAPVLFAGEGSAELSIGSPGEDWDGPA